MTNDDDDKPTPGPTADAPASGAKPRVQLQLDDAIAQGTYANLALLSHSESEFVLDFAFVPPTRAGARVRSRIVMSPRQAKRLAASLQESIGHYEKRFGSIPTPTTPEGEPPLH